MKKIIENKQEAVLFVLTLAVIMTVAAVPYSVEKLLFTGIAVAVTYFSFRYICKSRKFAVAGTFLLLLSQYYLVQLSQNEAAGEYRALLFVPVYFAGIYDMLALEGRRVYLLLVAFVGLLLTNAPSALIGILVICGLFIISLPFKAAREAAFSRQKAAGLGAAVAIMVLTLSVCIYIYVGQESQLVAVGDNTLSLAGFFAEKGRLGETVEIGIGFPILMLLVCQFMFGRIKNIWAAVFSLAGGALILAITDIFPWRLFQDSIINMIAYPYRLYPFALCALIMGSILVLAEKCAQRANKILLFIVVLALFFGVWQNWY